MEVDASETHPPGPSPRQRIVQGLVQRGIPLVQFDQAQLELVAFLHHNKSLLTEVVLIILPKVGDASKDHILESLLWLQWLMFEHEPKSFLTRLTEKAVDQRAVCGAVWGQNELAYRCRTCEHDPTCAICVGCFQNGNHKDHDYSIIYTEGGCCDCGDITAWKREGFCSKHKGIENIQLAIEEFPHSLGPVLDALFLFWKDKLLALRHGSKKNHEDNQGKKFADELTSSIVDMLLFFCNCSENLLYFISKRISCSVELLQLLVEGEVLLDETVVQKLHEMLLKFLGEPTFKYEFAKTFVQYYPHIINEAVKECSDSVLKSYPLLASFSVQIFTVPSLTLRLVKEVNLLGMLLECLGHVFHSCMGEDGCLQGDKWYKLNKTTFRVIVDIRFTLSHVEIPKYVVREQPSIIKAWIRLLSHVQGMEPQKRATGRHIEQANENLQLPFILEYHLQLANDLLIKGACSVEENEKRENDFSLDFEYSVEESLTRLPKIGRHSEENSVSLLGNRNSTYNFAPLSSEEPSCSTQFPVPPIVVSSISESLKAIEDWLESEAAQDANSHAPEFSGSTMSNFLLLQKNLFKNRSKSSSEVTGRKRVQWRDIGKVRRASWGDGSWGTNKSTCNSDIIAAICHQRRDVSVNQMALDSYIMEIDSEKDICGILNSADWTEITFDVSSEEISFHVPLHRFLSLALQKGMDLYSNKTCVSEIAGVASAAQSTGDDFFKNILKGSRPYGFSSSIMEHLLRLRVFCAQFLAGMWRRNGDVGIWLFHLYYDVRRSNIGIEMDLFLLQCCAAVAPPESFVTRILERFALSSYLSLNLSEYNEHEPVLVQEMLTLLIQIVKERRFCGFSEYENLQRELVQELAIGDATHSQLNNALPSDLSKIDGVQKVVDSLATFTKPSGMKQGVYSLRKEYWKELDLYHPRWKVRDLQVAEERYLRFCKVASIFVQVPRWTKIYAPLNSIGKVATSKMTLQIVRAVLFYAVYAEKPSTCRAPDDVIIRALHLLSLSLDICETSRACKTEGDLSNLGSPFSEGEFPMLKHATEIISTRVNRGPARWVHESLLSLLVLLTKKHRKENDHSSGDPGGPGLSSLVEGLLKRFSQLTADCRREVEKFAPGIFDTSSARDSNKLESSASIEDRKAKARQHQAAILEKLRAEQSKFIASVKSLEGDSDIPISGDRQTHEQIAPACSLCHDTDSGSPLALIVLLQRSQLSSLTEEGTPSWEDISQYGSQYSALEKMVRDWLSDDSVSSEAAPLTELEFDHDLLSVGSHGYQNASADGNMNLQQLFPSTETDSSSGIRTSEHDLYECILKEMNQLYCSSNLQVLGQQPLLAFAFDGSVNSQKTGFAAAGQHKSALSSDSSQHYSSLSFLENISHPAGASTLPELPSEDKFSPLNCDGIYISSCGHAVHQQCHDRYLSTLRPRVLGFEGRHLVDPSRGEFLCPVCRRFANSILPLFPGEHDESKKTALSSSGVFSFGDTSIIAKLDSNLRIRHALALLLSSSKMLKEEIISSIALGKVNDVMEPALEPSIRKLCELYFPKENGNLSEICKTNNSLLLWDTLKYSIVSTEIAARGKGGGQCEGSASAAELLHEELCSSNGMSLSALLHVAQITRCLDCSQLQLRFKSIQLFASSICVGISGETDVSDSGRNPCLQEDSENGNSFPQKFLKVAADPILIHDPFSSLMWILFSLPLPFISSPECLLSLVHLFHAVCMVQALITCYGKHQFDASTLAECALIDICKTMGKSELVRQHFMSRYIDCSHNLEVMVCKLTVPYLRKCALLWKLLKVPTPVPGGDRHGTTSGPGTCGSNHSHDGSNICMTEFGLAELENMFQICSLNVLCNDKVVQALTSGWCEHFCQYICICKQANVLYCNPSVPFQLMKLPSLYQDLLQRYNKERCPNCNMVPKEPALCLLCGKICSPNWNQCCRESRCHAHAKRCGAGIGVFLLIKSTKVLLRSSSRQSLWPSPYLDAFGEEDTDVSRGKPLFLSEERYSALTNLIASHGLDRSSEVLRRTAIML